MKTPRIAAVMLALALLPVSCSRSRPPRADLVLKNGRVYTMDAARHRAAAVAVKAGRILLAGSDAEAERTVGAETRVIDLKGQMVLPGFCDGHIHLLEGGIEMNLCNLAGVLDRKEAFRRIAAYAAANPHRAWISGGRWELPLFPGANPSRADLDRLVPDRPACLDSADGHSVWVNSRALALAGIDRRTKDPADGRIERDAAGEPSGCLRESAAHLVLKLVPAPTPQERLEGLRKAQQLANRYGITAIQEARADAAFLDTYMALDRRGGLSVRVQAALETDPAAGPGQVAELVRRRQACRGPLLKSETAKIFLDGVLEARTAALLAPYLGGGRDAGTPRMEAGPLAELARALDRAGFQIHVHAIGDRAVRMALDAFDAVRRADGPRDSRHSITHLELIDPADLPRFRRLGVAAVFQSLWAYPDPYITELTIPVVGPERARRLYPVNSLRQAGAVIVGGSDWPVSTLDPLPAIQVAMTRRSPADPAGPALNPPEAVDLDEMLAAYTIRGAWLNRSETETGSIEAGKLADLVVLPRDLHQIKPGEIGNEKVVMTILAGRIVYQNR